ncbi:hypothetical protein JC221_075 [Yersinia phage JC221]|nr:hypothetical protein JC221_075 [Yersinia phage JC221]
MIKRPYCLVYRCICSGGMPVGCWQLIEENEAFLCPDGETNIVYSVLSICAESMRILNEDTKEEYTLTSNDDSRKFNVYWKSDNEFERKPE